MRTHPAAVALPLLLAVPAGLSQAEVVTRFVDPLATDPGIIEVELPNAGVVTKDHFVATDPSVDGHGLLFLWFPGSGAAPAQYTELTIRSGERGYDALALTYPSWPPVNDITTNSQDPGLPEAIRRERLFGEDLFPDFEVDEANSIVNRTVKVLESLAAAHPDEGWGDYLTPTGGLRWSRIVAGGHSQGAGHAVFLTKQFPLAGAFIFAGPGDFVQGLGTAPWVFWDQVTPPERIFAFTHVDDRTAAGFFANQRIIGLEQFGAIQVVDGRDVSGLTSHMLTSTRTITNGAAHSAIVVDEFLPRNLDGENIYLDAWTSMFDRAAVAAPEPIDCAAYDFAPGNGLDGFDVAVFLEGFRAASASGECAVQVAPQ
ncbi:MAG: hypothetical protein AAGI30_09740 [Planctomycetota bacterium]